MPTDHETTTISPKTSDTAATLATGATEGLVSETGDSVEDKVKRTAGFLDVTNPLSMLKWGFPSSVTLVGLAAFIGWTIGTQYLVGFYGYFSLTLQEVGATHLEVLERVTSVLGPWLLLLVLSFIAATIVVPLLSRRADQPSSPSKVLSGWRSKIQKFVNVCIFSFGFLVLFLPPIIGIAYLPGMQVRGIHDADTVVTLDRADYYVSAKQRIFGAKTVLAAVSWVGLNASSPLVGDSGRDNTSYVDEQTKSRNNIVRILGQNGESTVFFNLADCAVYRVPTANIVLVNPRVSYGGTEGSSPVTPCPSSLGPR